LGEKLRPKFPATTRGCSMVNIASLKNDKKRRKKKGKKKKIKKTKTKSLKM